MTAPLVYADHNATTPVAPEVRDAMRPALEADWFNPSSMYEAARRTAVLLAQARADVAAFLGAPSPAEILFTSCATESNNTAIFGTAAANPSRRHIVSSAVEHPAVLEPLRELQRRGYEVTLLPVDRQGRLSLPDLVRAVRPGETLLVSLMHANNESGVVFPIADAARLVKAADPEILFHTDATQSVSKLPVDLSGDFAQVDLLSFSGHKMHAPKGVGALFVRKGTPVRPFLYGGHQESGRRGGTENLPHILALAAACRLAKTHEPRLPELAAQRDRLQNDLLRLIPFTEVNGIDAPRTPNTLSLSFHAVEGEAILYALDAQGICASTGSACSSGSLEPSHVLRAMNVPFAAMHGSLRLSFSVYNPPSDYDRIREVLPAVIASLRRLSPYWDDNANAPRSL